MQNCENILIVCTYKVLGNMYRYILEKNNLSIDVEVMDNRYGRDMQKVLSYIDSFREKGKEIIITRGFLAEQIRRNLAYEVIEINISGIDVLRALHQYAGKKLCIGIVESNAFSKVVCSVAELLGFETREYKVVELADFDKGIEQAQQDGVDMIVGGAWVNYDAENFRNFPIPYIPIESSEESIEASLKNAMRLYGMLYEERKRKEILETIIEFSDGGLLAVDENLNLLGVNTYAKAVWGLKEAPGERLDIPELQQAFSTVIKTGKLLPPHLITVNQEEFLMNVIPMIVERNVIGAVATLKQVEEVRESEKLIRRELAQKGWYAKYTLDHIQGHSEKITGLKRLAATYAKTDATVLILGESGTGKELFAQAIHNCSPRKNNPFVALNCSALPASLLESELFGYVDGAFTGARKGGKAGVFEMAHKGTIFLDEIGDIDLGVQARLLRVLQEKEVMRIGDNKVLSIDVRVVAATNKDLYQAVEEGRFREDLYYRLNLLDLTIPPLRERKEDIGDIAEASIHSINQSLNCHIRGFDPQVIQKLEEYDWRGNIRELRNILEKMAIVVQHGIVRYPQVEFVFQDMDRIHRRGTGAEGAWQPPMNLREMEKQMITQALETCEGNRTKAAALLGIDRSTLFRKMAKM